MTQYHFHEKNNRVIIIFIYLPEFTTKKYIDEINLTNGIDQIYKFNEEHFHGPKIMSVQAFNNVIG